MGHRHKRVKREETNENTLINEEAKVVLVDEVIAIVLAGKKIGFCKNLRT